MLHTEDSQPAIQDRETTGHTRSDEPNSASEPTGVAQPPWDLTLTNITCDQVRDANVMVAYAVRRGLELPPDLLQDVAIAKKQLIDGQVSSEVGARFIATSAKLARLISPATPDSIHFSRGQNSSQKNSPKTIAKRYYALGIAVFFVLLIIQGYWFVLNGFLDDIKRTSELLKSYQTLLEIGWQEIGHNPTGEAVEM
jgi:hypothetical protein